MFSHDTCIFKFGISFEDCVVEQGFPGAMDLASTCRGPAGLNCFAFLSSGGAGCSVMSSRSGCPSEPAF